MNKGTNNELEVSKKVSKFVNLYSDIWWSTNTDFPELPQETGYWYKRNQEKETDKFVDQFFKAIEQFPAGEKERENWKQKIQLMIDRFIDKSDLISEKDKEILLKEDMLQATESFVNEVKNFNPDIDIDDIGQAIRNVWIMNLIQLLFSKKPQLTPSIFGYSMLYPYTDNYLDNTQISTEEKIRITNVFQRRLSGEKLLPGNDYETSLFKLVSKIEKQYDRSIYPEVFESLLCIHNAQRKSLQQQDSISGPYEKDILGISIEKGGISVLADAYLVNGILTEREAAFFFGYGMLLQICDDLQDVKEDFINRHMTVISQLFKKWPLDNVTNKLISFTNRLLDDMDCFNCENKDELKSLIYRNCINLILFAAAKNKKMYSRRYFNKIMKHFPYRAKYMQKLYAKLKKKYSNINESYNGVETSQIFLYALKRE
ncbi:MAG: hypothetical protein ABRQ27_10135 [Clostridiaceae bacterium]